MKDVVFAIKLEEIGERLRVSYDDGSVEEYDSYEIVKDWLRFPNEVILEHYGLFIILVLKY